MGESATYLTLFLGLMALIGPGLLYLGIKIGTLTGSTRSAHHRIDRHEEMFDQRIKTLTDALSKAIEAGVNNAWRNCPLANSKHEEGASS